MVKQTVSHALHGNQRISCKVSKESDSCRKEIVEIPFIEVDGEIHNNNLEKDIHRDKILQNFR